MNKYRVDYEVKYSSFVLTTKIREWKEKRSEIIEAEDFSEARRKFRSLNEYKNIVNIKVTKL